MTFDDLVLWCVTGLIGIFTLYELISFMYVLFCKKERAYIKFSSRQAVPYFFIFVFSMFSASYNTQLFTALLLIVIHTLCVILKTVLLPKAVFMKKVTAIFSGLRFLREKLIKLDEKLNGKNCGGLSGRALLLSDL